MMLKAHTDHAGAIIASTDSAMLNYARDNYAYSWPRDGACIIWPLLRLGYTQEALNLFRFYKESQHPQGYLMHKYRADGALGSSWHPYVHGEINAPPIQVDETAAIIFMFSQLFDIGNKPELLEEFYESFIKPAADFIAGYIDHDTGLPKPSYDLWEEKFMTATYTVATVFAGLSAAATLAEAAGQPDDAINWRSTAEDIREAGRRQLFNNERQAFYKGLHYNDGAPAPDQTIDLSSFYGVFMYGLFPAGSAELAAAAETIRATFGKEDSPVLPRYEDDNYQRESELPNAWYITTLWMAQYHIECGEDFEAEKIISWVEQSIDSSQMLSEQLSAVDTGPRSVSPLAWSHAEYMGSILDLYTKRDASK